MADTTTHRSNLQHSLPAADPMAVAKRDHVLLEQIIAAIAEGKTALASLRAAERTMPPR